MFLPDFAFFSFGFCAFALLGSCTLGVVVDERFNSAGQAADYIIQVLGRQLLSYWAPRYDAIYRTPSGSIQRPKVMMINEFSGSGGDAMSRRRSPSSALPELQPRGERREPLRSRRRERVVSPV